MVVQKTKRAVLCQNRMEFPAERIAENPPICYNIGLVQKPAIW